EALAYCHRYVGSYKPRTLALVVQEASDRGRIKVNQGKVLAYCHQPLFYSEHANDDLQTSVAGQSARGLAHSKTLARGRERLVYGRSPKVRAGRAGARRSVPRRFCVKITA